ncbi:MAG: hypothetical protein H7234_01095 [Herminiimonas sp.]|nr:hypothetical protein [Herminiimonas sp.]
MLGVGAAPKGNLTLLVVGLVVNVPLIVFGSGLVLRLMQRAPVVIVLAGRFLAQRTRTATRY